MAPQVRWVSVRLVATLWLSPDLVLLNFLIFRFQVLAVGLWSHSTTCRPYYSVAKEVHPRWEVLEMVGSLGMPGSPIVKRILIWLVDSWEPPLSLISVTNDWGDGVVSSTRCCGAWSVGPGEIDEPKPYLDTKESVARGRIS